MKSIDIKSLLIGILGTALVMVLMGQSSVRNQYDVECVYVPKIGEISKKLVACRRFDLLNPEYFTSRLKGTLFSLDNFYSAY